MERPPQTGGLFAIGKATRNDSNRAMPDHVIFSYALSGPKIGKELRGEEIAEEIANDTLAWVHLDRSHPDTRIWMRQHMSYLDPNIIETLLADETRPRATVIGEGMLVILRGVNLNEGSDLEDMVSLRLWIDEKRIISMRRRHVRAAQDIKELIETGTVPTTSAKFLALLIDQLDDRIEAALRLIDDSTDAVEEQLVMEANPKLRHPITDIRRRTIQMRRHIAPQREAVGAIKSTQLAWVDMASRTRMNEAQDRLTRFVEDLDAIRERAQVVKDELANALADRLNRNTYTLSVIAAMFLPLSFATSLVATNLIGLPGEDHPNGFAMFCGILVLLVVVQVILFRILRWF